MFRAGAEPQGQGTVGVDLLLIEEGFDPFAEGLGIHRVAGNGKTGEAQVAVMLEEGVGHGAASWGEAWRLQMVDERIDNDC